MRNYTKKLLVLSLLVFQAGFAQLSIEEYEPYYAGPLVSLTATPIPVSKISSVTFIPFECIMGYFDHSHERQKVNHWLTAFKPYSSIETGITDWMDMRFDFATYYAQKKNTTFIDSRNRAHYDHAVYLGDMAFYLQVQFLQQKRHTWVPSMLFFLKETFPTGKYDRLSPKKFHVDASGEGLYQSTFSLNIEKVVFWFPYHPINFIWNAGFTLASRAYVHGFHIWGGGYGTKGHIKPADLLYQWFGFFSIEYSFNQKWVLNGEVLYYNYSHTKFRGTPGFTREHTLASNTLPSRENIDLTATLEYSFNDYYAVMLGATYTVWGKNIRQNVQGVLEINAGF